jgi:uncharacterized protein (TIGR03437 family)
MSFFLVRWFTFWRTAGLLIPLACCAQNYTITTVAGGGRPPTGNGDGGPATSAVLDEPWDVVLDGSGNLYIAASQVRKVTPTGTITTVAGMINAPSLGDGGPAVEASLEATAIAIDSAGNLFIADSQQIGSGRIRKVDSNGIITTYAGGGPPSNTTGDGGPAIDANFGQVLGIATDASGNVYFLDGNGVLRKVDKNGIITSVAGRGSSSADGIPAISAGFGYPSGVAVDGAGNIYVVDANQNRVRLISPNGTITTVAGSGSATYSGDNGPATKAGIASPWHVAVDASGNLYISERVDGFDQSSGNFIRKVSGGTIYTIAGNGNKGFSGDGGPATSAEMGNPEGLAVSSTGKVYIADNYSAGWVRLLTPSATPPTVKTGGVVPVYSSSTTIQPGSWVSIFGNNLADATALWNGDFPISLGGTSVTINGKNAYLWFVSPTQINFQAPDDTTTGPVPVVVTTPNGTVSSTVSLGSYAPSFSLLNATYPVAIVLTKGPGNSGQGYDIIGPVGAFTFPTRPVNPGETLILYGVGFGPTNPPVNAGAIFSGAAACTTVPEVTVGGVPATVAFAGVIEAGLYQINLIVPNAGSGDQSLQAKIGGVTTQSNIAITVQ